MALASGSVNPPAARESRIWLIDACPHRLRTYMAAKGRSRPRSGRVRSSGMRAAICGLQVRRTVWVPTRTTPSTLRRGSDSFWRVCPRHTVSFPRRDEFNLRAGCPRHEGFGVTRNPEPEIRREAESNLCACSLAGTGPNCSAGLARGLTSVGGHHQTPRGGVFGNPISPCGLKPCQSIWSQSAFHSEAVRRPLSTV